MYSYYNYLLKQLNQECICLHMIILLTRMNCLNIMDSFGKSLLMHRNCLLLCSCRYMCNLYLYYMNIRHLQVIIKIINLMNDAMNMDLMLNYHLFYNVLLIRYNMDQFIAKTLINLNIQVHHLAIKLKVVYY